MTENPETEECELVRVLRDGTLVVRSHGVDREIQIEGIQLPQPPPPLYFEIFERLARQHKPLRCTFQPALGEGRVPARVEYYAWHDKSGPVWANLAILLSDAGGGETRGEESR